MTEATRGEGPTVEVGLAIPGVLAFEEPGEDGDAVRRVQFHTVDDGAGNIVVAKEEEILVKAVGIEFDDEGLIEGLLVNQTFSSATIGPLLMRTALSDPSGGEKSSTRMSHGFRGGFCGFWDCAGAWAGCCALTQTAARRPTAKKECGS